MPPMLESPFSASISSEKNTNTEFDEAGTSKKLHFFNQQEMDNLIQDVIDQEKCRIFDFTTERVVFVRSYQQGIQVYKMSYKLCTFL